MKNFDEWRNEQEPDETAWQTVERAWNYNAEKLAKAIELLESCQRNVHMSRFEWDEIERFLNDDL